jgi:hypothetical protein
MLATRGALAAQADVSDRVLVEDAMATSPVAEATSATALRPIAVSTPARRRADTPGLGETVRGTWMNDEGRMKEKKSRRMPKRKTADACTQSLEQNRCTSKSRAIVSRPSIDVNIAPTGRQRQTIGA